MVVTFAFCALVGAIALRVVTCWERRGVEHCFRRPRQRRRRDEYALWRTPEANPSVNSDVNWTSSEAK